MLKEIIIVTLVVNSLGAVEAPYTTTLGYHAVQRGRLTADEAGLWAAPAMRGKPFLILEPPGRQPVRLRFIEDPAARVPAAGTSFGWNAVELLAQDPDALVAALAGTAFQVVGPPRSLGKGPAAPRAMQVTGPARELLYLTRLPPGAAPIPMSPAVAPVDRVFMMVVGGPSLDALRDFYGRRLGLALGETVAWQITSLSRALGLPPETTYPLAVARLPRDFMVELDGYPAAATPRRAAPEALPGGVAMVTFGVSDLSRFELEWRAPAARLPGFPYNGQLAAAAIGPAGEWLELVEVAGLPRQGN